MRRSESPPGRVKMSPKNKNQIQWAFAPILLVLLAGLLFWAAPRFDVFVPHIKLTKYRIDGSLRSRWPKRLYEGGSGIVTLTMIPSGREFQEQPKNEGGL